VSDLPWLVISLEQGWANGPIATGDLPGVRRWCRSLAPLRGRYRVGAGITPSFAFTNPGPTEAILDVLRDEGVPFWLDAVSSDVLAMMRPDVFAARSSLGSPFDLSHGIPLPVGHLQALAARYGTAFAGCRGFEQIITSRTLACGDTLDWAKGFAPYRPGGSFYTLKNVEPFVDFCHDTGRPFFWAEPMYSPSEYLWPGTPPRDDGWFETYSAKKFEAHISWLAGAYPGTLVVAFNNNLPASAARQFTYWNDLPKSRGGTGWGLGSQSWAWSPDGIATEPIARAVSAWTAHAFTYGARVVWLEPPWMFHRWPLWSFGPTSAAPLPDSGEALPTFQILVDAVLAVPRAVESPAVRATPAAKAAFLAPDLPTSPRGGAPLPCRLA
jgi:hypothetical protein